MPQQNNEHLAGAIDLAMYGSIVRCVRMGGLVHEQRGRQNSCAAYGTDPSGYGGARSGARPQLCRDLMRSGPPSWPRTMSPEPSALYMPSTEHGLALYASIVRCVRRGGLAHEQRYRQKSCAVHETDPSGSGSGSGSVWGVVVVVLVVKGKREGGMVMCVTVVGVGVGVEGG